MRKVIGLVFLILLPAFALASEAPLGMTKFNVLCPAKKVLPQLDAAFHECGHSPGGSSCSEFVSLFKQVLPESDCQRPFDHTPDHDYVVPAVWLAGDAFEDFVRLLSTLKTPAARCLFGSAAFRATLDGALAEDYGDKSRAVGRQIGATCNGL